MIDPIAVGKKINYFRQKNHYSQEDLAHLLCISRQAISRWEVGLAIPTIDNLIELSKLFKVTFEELLCLEEFAVIDENDIFKNHDRLYIVNKICKGELNVSLSKIFDQLTKEERYLILFSLKNRKVNIDEEFLSILTIDEKVYMEG